jgi:putative SOS response-associated peptidase YedK
VLDPDAWARWLDPGLTDPGAVAALLASPPAGRFAAYPVSTEVNGSRANGPHLLAPLGAGELRGVVDPTTGEVIGA